ncbi:MAG TPA: hypothetical protein VMC07_00915 [Candidatus Omnitrophota bacterium]|nr:hypothetical protein [Candidatus Omnitrophota bacterium]
MENTLELMSEMHPGLARNYYSKGHGGGCFTIAREIAGSLLQEGKAPYIAKIQGLPTKKGEMIRLRPNLSKSDLEWDVHFVCCEGNEVYDPMVSPKPVPISEYCRIAFKNLGTETEIFMSAQEVRQAQ